MKVLTVNWMQVLPTFYMVSKFKPQTDKKLARETHTQLAQNR
ncbi:MAG: hypothetical protein ACJAVV_001882 [Alphaproteobacteria bacterium]|jgi:hypothetical protein